MTGVLLSIGHLQLFLEIKDADIANLTRILAKAVEVRDRRYAGAGIVREDGDLAITLTPLPDRIRPVKQLRLTETSSAA